MKGKNHADEIRHFPATSFLLPQNECETWISPEWNRDFQVTLTIRFGLFQLRLLMIQPTSEAEGSIKVELAYVSWEIETAVAPLLNLALDQPVKMCSWCQSIYDQKTAAWLPLAKALAQLPLLHESEIPTLTHGCCPDCFLLIRGKVNEYTRGR